MCAASDAGMAWAVRIERLVVLRDRVRAIVRVAPFAHTTTPQLAARAMQEFPLIERHACVNEKGNTFGLVIEHTPLPHLMEHLVIALQMQAELQSISHARRAELQPTLRSRRTEPQPASHARFARSVSLPESSALSQSEPSSSSHPSFVQFRRGRTLSQSELPPLSHQSPPGEARALEDFTYVGTSEWTNEAAGEARIEANFADDLVALWAFRDAADFLNEAVIRTG